MVISKYSECQKPEEFVRRTKQFEFPIMKRPQVYQWTHKPLAEHRPTLLKYYNEPSVNCFYFCS